jgi:hypothetical protein
MLVMLLQKFMSDTHKQFAAVLQTKQRQHERILLLPNKKRPESIIDGTHTLTYNFTKH